MSKDQNPAPEQIVVGLDIGTTKICAIVGKRNEYGKINILGLGKADSDGVSRGVVVNIEKTVQAIKEAVGDKKGIRRYGHFDLVMDEARASVSLDLSNRAHLVWDVKFTVDRLGEMDTELFQEFFNALVNAGGITYHASQLAGTNNHHVIEAIFKASAKALRMAVETDPRAADQLPSTKGAL